MMRLELRCAPVEDDASIARRARVLAYRVRCGELVVVSPWDPAHDAFYDALEAPRPHGNAAGALPEAL